MSGLPFQFPVRRRNRPIRVELRALHATRRARVRAQKRTRFAGFVLLAAVLLGAAGWIAWIGARELARRVLAENQAFRIREITVESTGELLKPEFVVDYLHLRRGQSLLGVDIARLRRDLELCSEVERAEVGLALPDRLAIRIAERTPVASLVAGATRYQVDRRGVVMDLLSSRRLSDAQRKAIEELPVITGAAVADMRIQCPVISSEIHHALALFQRVDRGDLDPGLEIRSVDVSRRGFLAVTTADGCRTRLAIADLDQQLRRWSAVLRDARARTLRVATIDLSLGGDVPVTFVAAQTEAP
ncbi:MAG: FtsQ-type POTRA domain-containing protein [Verrucomicrobiae bacterium]|nr:FtsQ-type POTRA domain-containing protein [Verrucomicrobiae bacterium]